MKMAGVVIVMSLLFGSARLIAEDAEIGPGDEYSSSASYVTARAPSDQLRVNRPFTIGASMESVSTLGVQLQVATALNDQMNLRGSYGLLLWKKWITSEGFATHGTVTLGSAGLSLDLYPFAKHGLRFSPGLLLHNSQVAAGSIPLTSPAGGAFRVNGQTYYSAPANVKYVIGIPPEDQGPVYANEGVNLRRTGVTLTTGWGNMVSSRKEGHWSFPVEAGVALLGSPSMVLNTITGQICDAEGQNCAAASSSQQLRRDVQAQFAGYKEHLGITNTYPILSCGIAYRFGIRTSTRGR